MSPTQQQHTPPENKSVGQLLSDVSSDFSKLMRQEVQLAKAELKQEAKEGAKAAGYGTGAGFAAWMTALFASLAAMFGLAYLDALNLGWSALIVTAVWAIVAAVLAMRAKEAAKQVGPPNQTIDSLKEDAKWARNQP